MENPYRSRGYEAELVSDDAGDFLTIRRHGKAIAEVAISVFQEGPHAAARMIVKRFDPTEFDNAQIVNDFDGSAET